MTTRPAEDVLYVGLDGEMTGPRLGRHKLFEIGVDGGAGKRFESRIGWTDFEYDPAALAAVGVSPEDVRSGPPAADVDASLATWLAALGATAGRVVAVGWAVGRFDLPFVARTLPTASRYLSRQTVDLGAVCHTFAGSVVHDGRVRGVEEWKRAARAAAADALTDAGEPPRWHHAGYDAAAALVAWDWLRARITTPAGG
jgi:hypothetical protein